MAKKIETVPQVFDRLKTLYKEKNKEYGDQAHVLDEVMKTIFKELELVVTPETVGDFHFIMELQAKTLRIMNIMFKKKGRQGCTHRKEKCRETADDVAVYAAMLSSKWSEES